MSQVEVGCPWARGLQQQFITSQGGRTSTGLPTHNPAMSSPLPISKIKESEMYNY